MEKYINTTKELLFHQLRNYWIDIDEAAICQVVPIALSEIKENYSKMNNMQFNWNGEVTFSPYISTQWMIFLYRLSRLLYKSNVDRVSADQVYYLNKVMHSIDWYYEVELPTHFGCEHPLGSILGKATYGDYFFIYQGTTVGGNRRNGILEYPTIGSNVILFANATVLGTSHIGSNVVVSADTYLINECIPDNCIVFGKSPDVKIRKKSEEEIKSYSEHIWKWSKE